MLIMAGKVENYILKKLKNEKLHFALVDPDVMDEDRAVSIIKTAQKAGSDAIMVGGSTNASGSHLDSIVKIVKKNCSLPVILFPGCAAAVSPYADAIFFMSFLNSRNPYFITKSQALGAFPVKIYQLEALPMAYLVIEPGMTVGFIGEAELLPRSKPRITAAYALAGKYLGMRFVYLEAGSGADFPVPNDMISLVRDAIDIPLIVGGGIRSAKQARAVVDSGADIVVTGTIAEENSSNLAEIVRAIKG
ncbi:MAG: phosphoglycerol geranylgeranyltransferase [Candidatus Methanofastidiosia archaeon]